MTRLRNWIWATLLVASVTSTTAASDSGPPQSLEARVGDAISRTLQGLDPAALVAIDGGVAARLPRDRRWTSAGRHWVAVVQQGSEEWFVVDVSGSGGGGAERPHPAKVIVDRSPPHARFEIEGPQMKRDGITVITGSTRISTWLEDPSGVASGRWVWGERSTGAQQILSALPAGPQQVLVMASDELGNTGIAGELALVVDREGPEIDWEIDAAGQQGNDGRVYYTPPVEMKASARDDAGVAPSLRLIGPEGVRSLTPGETVSVDAGKVILEAQDGLGNVSRVRPNIAFDQQGPEIVLQRPDGKTVKGKRLKVRAGDAVAVELLDAGSGAASVEYRLDQGPWMAVDDALSFPEPGRYKLELRARDRLGNESSRQSKLRVAKPRRN